MRKSELRFRQIHLDFHTSEHIAGIGEAFDPDDFASTLERARVDQGVTCVLGGEALAFERGAKYVRFVVPRVEGHQMIEIAFAG